MLEWSREKEDKHFQVTGTKNIEIKLKKFVDNGIVEG